MDSHNCRRIVRNGRVENEGNVEVGGFPPYPIAQVLLKSSAPLEKVRNPNPEIRRNSKCLNSKLAQPVIIFGFRTSFGFRISGFGLHSLTPTLCESATS